MDIEDKYLSLRVGLQSEGRHFKQVNEARGELKVGLSFWVFPRGESGGGARPPQGWRGQGRTGTVVPGRYGLSCQ